MVEETVDGLITHSKSAKPSLSHHFEPILIPHLQNVQDIKCGVFYSIALCSSNNDQLSLIISFWCRLYAVPEDIKSLLIMFSKFTKVYSTVYTGRLHGDRYPKRRCYGWREMELLNGINIIKIQCGYAHSLFLDSGGVVWAAGANDDGECGLGDLGSVDKNESVTATEIKYFKDRGIKIRDIATGCYHNLAVDENWRIYAWGYNFRSQCGDGGTQSVLEPKLIETLKDYQVDTIRCGYHLSYCGTKCGKHFIWGASDDNECMTFDDKNDAILPHRVDNVIKEKCGCHKILGVYPGYYCTKVVCEC